ncbi:hypothetical protein ACGRHY_05375 [Streptomyces sp. HK10]|uniref:hypothetical protein n=1 Tax=Streptomyces sp. HK10 TaxID=3373255 RepID=UPI0037478422
MDTLVWRPEGPLDREARPEEWRRPAARPAAGVPPRRTARTAPPAAAYTVFPVFPDARDRLPLPVAGATVEGAINVFGPSTSGGRPAGAAAGGGGGARVPAYRAGAVAVGAVHGGTVAVQLGACEAADHRRVLEWLRGRARRIADGPGSRSADGPLGAGRCARAAAPVRTC